MRRQQPHPSGMINRRRTSPQQRGGPGLRAAQNILPIPPDILTIIAHDVEKRVLTLDEHRPLHYSRGKRSCTRCGEPRMPSALNERGECQTLASCNKYLRQEEKVTSTLQVDWKKDNITPPRDNAEVAQIMQEMGCGRRQAYTIMRRRRAEEMDVSNVSEGQRVAVMSTLINIPEARKDATNLLVELHAINVKIDMHDTVKTLWALQKQGFVRFRERNNPRSLYAISVTDKGYSAWNHRYPVTLEAQTEATDVSTNVGPTLIEHEIAHERAKEVATAIANARALQQKVNDLGAGKPTPVKDNLIERPWTKGELSGWPWFCDLRNRALRAKKLNAAIKLLEEVGGHDEIVLTIMGETEFTGLENEVLVLLTVFGEIE